MRVLLAVTLLVFVSGALAGGKEKQEMMMWMKMKAMEGCLGESKFTFLRLSSFSNSNFPFYSH